MAKNNSKDINFQYYVDAVKQKKIHWHIFMGLIQDVSYSDLKRLKILNAILLTELTMNCSDLDKLKYLNVLLLSEFKKHILRENGLEMIEHDFLQDLQQEESENDKISHEIATDNKIQKSTNNEITENIFLMTNLQQNEEPKIEKLTEDDNEIMKSTEEMKIEISTDDEIQTLNDDGNSDNETQLSTVSEREKNFKEEIFDHKPSANIFLCDICNNKYYIYFHLKQHIKKVHEKKNNYNVHENQKGFLRSEDSSCTDDESNLTATAVEHHATSVELSQDEIVESEFGQTAIAEVPSDQPVLEFDGNDQDLCRVCGDEASGFHYGVTTCEGCKGFFKRSIQQNIQYSPCSNNHQCNVLRINRNQCQYCRFEKCITAGMSLEAVRMGRTPKRILQGQKYYKCESCGKLFSEAGYLKRHIRTLHESSKDHKCESCGRSFSRAENLKRHIHAVHEGRNDNKCESCGKSFSEAGYLKKHIHTVHESSKDHKCESCGKSFSRAENLKTHIHTVHEGHKDHKCESCGKEFSQAAHLKKHIHTVHEGHKDYKCEDCGKSFIKLHNLEQHLHIVHDGYKDHKCEYCAKSFSTPHSLKKHLKREHDD